MNDMTQAAFDYTALPVELAMTTRAAAERIKLRLKRTVEDIIEIGRELTAIKPSLDGCFDDWFEKETGLDRSMAYKFMQVAEKFGALNYSTSALSPTVLYLLAAPSTPDAVVEQAIEQTEAGEKVTVALVKQWKDTALEAKQRAEEFRQESNERRRKIRDLEGQIDLLKANLPEVRERIVAPVDYDAAKKEVGDLYPERQQQARWPSCRLQGVCG